MGGSTDPRKVKAAKRALEPMRPARAKLDEEKRRTKEQYRAERMAEATRKFHPEHERARERNPDQVGQPFSTVQARTGYIHEEEPEVVNAVHSTVDEEHALNVDGQVERQSRISESELERGDRAAADAEQRDSKFRNSRFKRVAVSLESPLVVHLRAAAGYVSETFSRGDNGDDTSYSRPPLIVKITGYRILNSCALLVFGTWKGVASYQGNAIISNTLDIIFGVVLTFL